MASWISRRAARTGGLAAGLPEAVIDRVLRDRIT
jgi:hypothetical protein